MKPILFLILTVFVFSAASAQFIFIPQKAIKTAKETIEKHEGIELTDPIPFSAIRIIDSRYDTTTIGFHWDSYLTLQDSTQPLALQHVIDKYYHTLYTPGKDTLVIQLEKLSIQEEVIRDTNFIFIAGYVSCKEYIGRNNAYKYYGSVDTLLKEKFSYKTIYSAHKNGKYTNYELWDHYLLRLLEAMIKMPAVSDSSANQPTTFFTVEGIKHEGLQKRNKPILTADSLQPGFYNNFSEFINDKPGFTYDSSDALPKLLTIMNYRVGKHISNEAPDTSYWGYCDGKNLYIRYRYNFYQLEKRDAGFYIAATLDGRRRDINNAGWDLLTGAAVLTAGIAAKQGVSFVGFDAIPTPDIPIVILPIDGTYILGLQLDWDTGKIIY